MVLLVHTYKDVLFCSSERPCSVLLLYKAPVLFMKFRDSIQRCQIEVVCVQYGLRRTGATVILHVVAYIHDTLYSTST
jgi:hypothetical protein